MAETPSMARPPGSPVARLLPLALFAHRDTEVRGICGDTVRTEGDGGSAWRPCGAAARARTLGFVNQ